MHIKHKREPLGGWSTDLRLPIGEIHMHSLYVHCIHSEFEMRCSLCAEWVYRASSAGCLFTFVSRRVSASYVCAADAVVSFGTRRPQNENSRGKGKQNAAAHTHTINGNK